MRNEAVAIMGSYGENAVSFLAYNLDHSDKEIRKLILDTLIQIGTENALIAIRACLNDDSINVKITAIEYLARLKDKKCLKEIEDLFKSNNEPMLRSTILEAMIDIGKDEDVHALVDILTNNGNIKNIDSIYIPLLIKFAGLRGTSEHILELIPYITDILIYAEDILSSLTNLKKRYDGEFNISSLLPLLKEIIFSDNIKDDLKFHGANLISDIKKVEAKEIIIDLAKKTKNKDLKEFCLGLIN